jgi:heme iron utilization protein
MKPDDPVSRGAEGAIAHLNEDHADALLEMAQTLGGAPEATAARCSSLAKLARLRLP